MKVKLVALVTAAACLLLPIGCEGGPRSGVDLDIGNETGLHLYTTIRIQRRAARFTRGVSLTLDMLRAESRVQHRINGPFDRFVIEVEVRLAEEDPVLAVERLEWSGFARKGDESVRVPVSCRIVREGGALAVRFGGRAGTREMSGSYVRL